MNKAETEKMNALTAQVAELTGTIETQKIAFNEAAETIKTQKIAFNEAAGTIETQKIAFNEAAETIKTQAGTIEVLGESLEVERKGTKASAIESLDAFDRKWKPLITQKQMAGLNREQAVAAIRNQLREDAKSKSDIAEQQLAAASGK